MIFDSELSQEQLEPENRRQGRGRTRVDELDVGDFVSGSIGELLRVVALESTDRVETVFNFGVEEFHSYFVGELGAWVHNCISPWELAPTHRLTMPKKQWQSFKDLIKKDGVIKDPIKYVEHNGQKYIVDGHHRARAAKELGLEKVPAEEVHLPFRGYNTVDDLFSK